MSTTKLARSSAPGFKVNFQHKHSVTLTRSIAEVFNMIGTGSGHERVTKLSKLCTTFEYKQKDTISVPSSTPLSELSVRTLPSSTTHSSSSDDTSAPTRSLPRQFFEFAEKVPLLGGVASYTVHIAGTLTWDEQAHLALYETETNTGILVWKLREFEEIDAKTTKVTETIKGKCPALLKSIVQKTTSKGHTAHMDEYHTLFA